MLLTSHTYILLSTVLCSRQFFQVNKASLQRTSSTIILLMLLPAEGETGRSCGGLLVE